MSRYNTEEEVDEIVTALVESIGLLRDESPVYPESTKEEKA